MSKAPALEAKSSVPARTDTDVVPVFRDAAKKAIPPKGRYAATVARFRKGETFTGGKPAGLQFVRFGGKGGTENALFLGMGDASKLIEESARGAGGNAWSKLVAEKSKSAAVHLDSLFEAKGLPKDFSDEAGKLALVRAFAEGMILGAYEFNAYKTAPEAKQSSLPARITFVTRDKALLAALDKELKKVRAIADAVAITRDWSNEPSNIGTPEHFAAQSKVIAKELGLKCTILTEKDAEREKMGLFLGVGQGAEREGRIVVLEYTPAGVSKPKTLALVGKGVTFDSGGISIKPSMRMEEMKHDMTGASTVMGAVVLAAKWKVPTRIVAIMAFTENMPDGDAIQPGNVIKSRAGKTVEIINTDAEGRLILADVLDYAHEFKPDAIVDVATLTGAVSIALGKHCCAILGSDEKLVESVRAAGTGTGERIWQLPLFDEYFDDLKSDTADMKNSANDSYGGTIRGAIFLKQFIKKGVPWAHLDIAATSSGMGHIPYYPKKGASGAYVRTLARLAEGF